MVMHIAPLRGSAITNAQLGGDIHSGVVPHKLKDLSPYEGGHMTNSLAF